MKSVQVFPNVRYVSLQDDEGPFGMFLISEDNSLYSVREVQSKEEFVEVYNHFCSIYSEVAA